MADLSAVWFAGLLGKIKQDGEDVELGGGLNFITPVVATFNSATKMVDVALDGSEEVSFTIVQSDGIDKPTRQKLNFLGFDVVDDVGNNAVEVGLGTPAQTGHILTWNAATGKWDAGRALTGNYTVTGELLAGTLTATVKVDAPIVDTNAIQGDGADITIDDDLVFSDGKGVSIGSGTPKSAVFGSGNALAFGADGWSIVSYISGSYHMFSDGPLLGDVYASLHPTEGLALTAGPLSIGASPASIGAGRLTNGEGLYWNNSGANVRGITIFNGDIFIGDYGATGPGSSNFYANNGFTFGINNIDQFVLSATTADFQNNNVVTTGYYQTGGASAALAGAYRSATGDVLMAGTTSVRVVHVDGSGNAFYGDSDSGTGTRAASAILGATNNVQVRVGGTIKVLFDTTAADFQDNNIVTTGYYSAGSSPAGLGHYRLPLNGQIAGKNDVTAADMLMLSGYTGGHVQLGSSGGNGASIVSVDVRTGGTFDVYNNGTPVYRIGASTFGVLAAATSPAAPQTYAASNVTTDRTYDANATTLDEVADVLGTLIADLRAFGFVV